MENNDASSTQQKNEEESQDLMRLDGKSPSNETSQYSFDFKATVKFGNKVSIEEELSTVFDPLELKNDLSSGIPEPYGIT